jgi:hypothetical protein
MSSVRLTTYGDLVQHITDFLGANVSEEAKRDARRSVQAGTREFATAHRWHYYMTRGRVQTVAPQNLGTIQYTHTGGTYERMLVLTGNTWPAWSPYGIVVIKSVPYEVASQKDAVTLQLSVNSNPGLDFPAGTPYNLYRDTYSLPVDCVQVDEILNLNHFLWLSYDHPRRFLSRQRIIHTPAAPHTYVIMGDPRYFGTLSVRFFPPPDQAYTMEFIYQRRPRQLNRDEYKSGNVTVAQNQATVTGSGTSWTTDMVGSVFRVGTSDYPTGIVGLNPYQAERVILAVNSLTSLTVDEALPLSGATLKYTISDPVDLEDGAMLNALLRCCEKQAGISRSRKDQPKLESNYIDALILAREADARYQGQRNSGPFGQYPYRLRDFPQGPDVP